MKGKKELIPMLDIKDPIRKLAVTWGDALNFEIWNTHKLASDIQNLFEEMKGEERTFSLKEALDIWQDGLETGSQQLSSEGDKIWQAKYFKDKFGVDI